MDQIPRATVPVRSKYLSSRDMRNDFAHLRVRQAPLRHLEIDMHCPARGESMSTSPHQPGQTLTPTLPSQSFRLDVPLHDLLQKGQEPSGPEVNGPKLLETRVPLTLPTPVFPQH